MWQHCSRKAAHQGITDGRYSAKYQKCLLPVCLPLSFHFKCCSLARTLILGLPLRHTPLKSCRQAKSLRFRETRSRYALAVVEQERQISIRFEDCFQVALIYFVQRVNILIIHHSEILIQLHVLNGNSSDSQTLNLGLLICKVSHT